MANKAIWQQAIVDASGDLVTDATVEVRRESDNGLASLFTDRAGLTGLGNPVLPGSAGYPTPGFVVLYVAPGVYKITTTSPTAGTRVLRYVTVFADVSTNQASDYLSANIAAGSVEDFDASSSLTSSIGVLALSPNSGDSSLESIAWDDFADGQELAIMNTHASNLVTLVVNGDASTGYRGFLGLGDLILNQNVTVKVKKSVGADSWLIIS
jgi:hypothetical protein